ncbi:MAG: glycosyltransferase [Treponema sp.]|nr:glycosyltransferase [Treponema sp.]
MLLSIITINRNNAAGLQKTIESVKNQTCKNYEHIIIDGASSDGSVRVIQDALKDADYAQHVTYWCSEKDSGIYNAMNKGIRHATGDFIAILNSGDCYVSDILLRINDIAACHPDAILYGAINRVRDGIFENVEGRSAQNIPTAMIVHPACFVPRALHERYGLYDEQYKIAGDYDMFCRFYKNNVPFYYTGLIVADFDVTGLSSISDTVFKENEVIQRKYGYYIAPSFKQRFKKRVKEILKKLFWFLS